MRVFSLSRFLKSKKRSATTQETKELLPILWENASCEVEIVPHENWDFIASVCKTISKSADDDPAGIELSQAYNQYYLPVNTLSKELRGDYLKDLFMNSKLPKQRRPNYQVSEPLNGECGLAQAFGSPGCTFFFNTHEEFVKHIWLYGRRFESQNEFKKIKTVLYQLGEEIGLMLVDWNRLEAVDLRNVRHINQYLKADRS